MGGEERVFQLHEAVDVVQRQLQRHGARGARHHVVAVGGVERAYHLDVHAADVGYLRELDVAAQHHRVGLHGQLRAHGADVVLAVVGHGIVGCDEGGHVAARLAGQIGVYLPVVALAARTAYGLVDVLRAAVVGRYDQVPVAEDLVQVAQEVGCGVRCLHRVAPLVEQRVDLEVVHLGRAGHELPEAAGTGTRHGDGVECRLDDGQVLQLQRQLVGLERFLEDGHVEIGRSQHPAHLAAQSYRVAVYACAYHFIIWHLHDGGHAVQAVYVLLARVCRVGIRCLAVFVGRDVGLRCVQVHQAVQAVGHGGREVYLVGVAILVGQYDFLFLHVVLVVHVVLVYDLCRQGQGHQYESQEHDHALHHTLNPI